MFVEPKRRAPRLPWEGKVAAPGGSPSGHSSALGGVPPRNAGWEWITATSTAVRTAPPSEEFGEGGVRASAQCPRERGVWGQRPQRGGRMSTMLLRPGRRVALRLAGQRRGPARPRQLGSVLTKVGDAHRL